jgi:ATP/maltotriose-dependent transcriptional regulator MalT
VAASALDRARCAGDLTTITRARELVAGRATGSFALANGASVSVRELEVLALIAAGRSNAQIAAELFVTVGTVKTHAHSIATKLGTTSRMETTARARELGLLG